MLKENIVILFRPFFYGMFCVIVNSSLGQKPFETFMVGNDLGIEEVAATVLPEQPAVSEFQDDDDGFETLTRGPLHEAFAEPIVSDPAPGLIVTQEPPSPINELAPEFRPDGDDAIWISGYWGWDEQREGFIWISGVYRIPPQGHQWVPGYWHQVSGGWQWVQGFWVEDTAESITYLPPPPTTLENGPSSPSPGLNYFYIPGNWTQSANSAYLWNVGYWHPMQDDLIWIPSHVVWTPRGCVFINAYWDRRLPTRGLCFAPVSIPRATYSRPGWCLRPQVVLNSQVVLHNLFVQPGYNHYLFGDYYGSPSAHGHVVPAYVYHQRRGSCDPLISFYSAYNARQGQDLIRWYGNQHAELNRNPSLRPPQHWSPIQSNVIGKSLRPDREPVHIAHTLDQANKIAGGPQIVPVPESFKQNMLKADLDRKRLSREREATEGKGNLLGSVATVGSIATVDKTFPTLSLPKTESIQRKHDLSSKELATTMHSDVKALRIEPNKVEQGVRRAAVPQRSPELRNSELNRPTKPHLDTRDIDLGKRFEQPTRIESNRISNPLDTNRILERSKKSEPKIEAPKIQSPLPNIQPRLPNIPTQPPTLQSPLHNRVIPPNESRARSIQNPGGLGNVQRDTRIRAPSQQIVSPNQSQPRFQQERQLPSRNLESNRRGNSDKNESGKKLK